MERFLSLLVASLCAAPLFYLLTSWLVVQLNPNPGGPDGTLGVAYLSVWLGFAAAIAGFFLVWFLARYFLVPQHLRYLQVAGGLGLLAWGIIGYNFAGQQPQSLTYDGHRATLDVEVRATRSLLAGKAIDSVITMDYVGGSNLDFPHPDRIRQEGAFTILPWETVPFEVKAWEMRVFIRNQPVLFPLNLPKRPTQSTEWSGWSGPVAYQETAPPEEARQGISLRYRFRLVPYGSQ